LLAKIPKPYPHPSGIQLQELEGLLEQINLKAEAVRLSFFQIAAEYFVRTCVSHKLLDGNKRSAVILLESFFSLNNRPLVLSEEELARYAVLIASIQTSQIGVEQKVAFLREVLKNAGSASSKNSAKSKSKSKPKSRTSFRARFFKT